MRIIAAYKSTPGMEQNRFVNDFCFQSVSVSNFSESVNRFTFSLLYSLVIIKICFSGFRESVAEGGFAPIKFGFSLVSKITNKVKCIKMNLLMKR